MFELTIGNFMIRQAYGQEPDKIWIERAGNDPNAGEGGDFSVARFEAAIRAFYEEHF